MLNDSVISITNKCLNRTYILVMFVVAWKDGNQMMWSMISMNLISNSLLDIVVCVEVLIDFVWQLNVVLNNLNWFQCKTKFNSQDCFWFRWKIKPRFSRTSIHFNGNSMSVISVFVDFGWKQSRVLKHFDKFQCETNVHAQNVAWFQLKTKPRAHGFP